jgi:hypothetical protein
LVQIRRKLTQWRLPAWAAAIVVCLMKRRMIRAGRRRRPKIGL